MTAPSLTVAQWEDVMRSLDVLNRSGVIRGWPPDETERLANELITAASTGELRRALDAGKPPRLRLIDGGRP